MNFVLESASADGFKFRLNLHQMNCSMLYQVYYIHLRKRTPGIIIVELSMQAFSFGSQQLTETFKNEIDNYTRGPIPCMQPMSLPMAGWKSVEGVYSNKRASRTRGFARVSCRYFRHRRAGIARSRRGLRRCFPVPCSRGQWL